jgi:hypothetical protein
MSKMFKLFTSILFLISIVPTISFSDTLSDSWATCRSTESVNCEGVCTRNGAGEIVLTSNSPTDATNETSKRDNCNEKPDKYKIRFYKVGLCTASPLATSGSTNPTGTEQGCYNFFDKSSETTDSGGTAIILSNSADGTVTADISLLDGVTDLANGSYDYGYAILSNMLELQHIETFSGNVKGNADTSGKVCWTIDKTTSITNDTSNIRGNANVVEPNTIANRTMKCGTAADSDLAYAKEIIDDFADDPRNDPFFAGGSTYESFSDNNGTDLGGTVAAKLLQSDNLTIATSANDAFRIFYGINFSSPIVIDDNTTKFEMSFNVSGAVSVDFSSDGSNNLIVAKTGADPFQIKVTAE